MNPYDDRYSPRTNTRGPSGYDIGDPNWQLLQLTPQEQAILRECKSEGIYKRAIPFGTAGAFWGWYYGRKGKFTHFRFGYKPLAFCGAIFGYFIGNVSYKPTCFRRLLNVPDGEFRKMYDRQFANRSHRTQDRTQTKYIPNEPFEKSSRATVSDIDIPSISTFDSESPVDTEDYGAQLDNELRNEEIPQSVVSYEELRQKNRSIVNPPGVQPTRTHPQAQYPNYRAQENVPVKAKEEETWERPASVRKTKYGDLWE